MDEDGLWLAERKVSVKTLTLDRSTLPAEAWRPQEPSAGRGSNRVSERELERIPAWISIPSVGSPESVSEIPAKLWDYSHYGFALLCECSRIGIDRLREGDRVRLKLDLGDGPLSAECIVRNTTLFKGCLRIGLARRDLVRQARGVPRIGAPRGECLRLPERMDLRAETQNPVLFGETSILRLTGMEPGLHFDFLSTDTALPLFPGQRLDVRMCLPTSGENLYRGEITALEKLGGGSLRVRMRPVFLSAGLANDLAELLAFEAGISPDVLKRYGFPTRFFRNRIVFRFVETMEDYEKVLILRRNAYVEVGKRGLDTRPEDMALSWDRTSRILCAFHDGVLVASAAATFPESPTAVLRSETAFPGNKFPGNPPKKSELLEINSLCTHKDYRRGDLLQAMFEQIARIFVLSDRDYIMNLSDSTLLPMYLGIGFKDQKEKGMFLGREHHLIRVSRRTVIDAEGIGLLRWNILYGDLMADLLSKDMLNLGFWRRLAIRARLALKPIAVKMLGARREREFQRLFGKSRNGSI